MAVRELDPKKKEIIEHVDGPLLVIAGPGAGKTTAIVERVVRLIGTNRVAPESIFVSTFTEKAAQELLTRISRRLMEERLDVSPNEMYIGTMHSLFLRILKDCAEFTWLKKNYRTFDDFDQKYFIYRKMYDFKKVENLDLVLTAQSRWVNADKLCSLLNKVREEAIDPARLEKADEPEVRALGAAYALYRQMLEDENAIDFSAIQSEMLTLVETQPQVLASLQEKIRYLIVDEYQDTNTIQERILLKLAGARANICVVGDEDQSIYRFRGASVRNILVNNHEDMVRSENYRRQLEVYSHIVEEKFGKKVSKMHLYYTRVEDETPYVTWDYEKERVAGTLQSFSRTVAKIENHQFSNEKVKKCARLCDGCDMRFYCGCK